MSALELDWAFGINSNIPNAVHLLNDNRIFYPVSNNGVVYNIKTCEQSFLNGHSNVITSCILSNDKQILITGDSGASHDNYGGLILIWNTTNNNLNCEYQLNENCGVQTMALNHTANLLAAIVNESLQSTDNNQISQHLMIWSVINDDGDISIKKMYQHKIETDDGLHHFITFNEDSTEIVTHSKSVKSVTFWSINNNKDDQIELNPFYTRNVENTDSIPDISLSTELTQSLYLPKSSGLFICGTNFGDLIVWNYDLKKNKLKYNELNDNSSDVENDNNNNNNVPNHRVIVKIIKIIRGSINCIDILNKYGINSNDVIAIASSNGSVRFYDFEFRVIGWLDYLNDEVISISFSLNMIKYTNNNIMDKFIVPNMIIGTKNNKIMQIISPDIDNKVQKNIIIDTFNTIATSMSSHPNLPIISIGNNHGCIQLWDIINKKILQEITLSVPVQITDIKFSLNGKWMIFSTDTNYLRIYDAQKFTEIQFFKNNYDGTISNLCFSSNSEWIALSQSNRISVYRYYYAINDLKKEKEKEWLLIGNFMSHNKDIIDLHFAEPSGLDNIASRNFPRLFSVGIDNIVNEYNLQRSSYNFGLRLKGTSILPTTTSLPTAIHFMSGIQLNKNNINTYLLENDDEDVIAPKYDKINKEWKYVEDKLIVFDDELKLHLYHAPRSIGRPHTAHSDTFTMNSSKSKDNNDNNDNQEVKEEKEEIKHLAFRRTVLGPSFGTPLKKMIQLRRNGELSDIFAFITYDQIIGLMKSPFNGNPNRYFGHKAHPSKIIGVEFIMNGKYMISCGGYDKSLLVWKVNIDELDQQINDSDEYNNLNEIYINMLNDTLYQDIQNYFYYVQIQKQGEISTIPRVITNEINIKQITEIFCALGSFLTNNDIDRIQKEIIHRYSKSDNHNEVTVNFEQFISLYINYRSQFEINIGSLHQSFDNIINNHETNNIPQHMNRQLFLDILQKKGDKLSREELMTSLEKLTGYKRKQLKNILPELIDAEFLIQNILGYQQQ